MAGATSIALTIALICGQSAPPGQAAAQGQAAPQSQAAPQKAPAASAEEVAQIKAQLETQSQALEESQTRTQALEVGQAEAQAQQEALAASQDSRASALHGNGAALESTTQSLINRHDLDVASLRELDRQMGVAAARAATEGSTVEAQATEAARARVHSALQSWQDENGREVPIDLSHALDSLRSAQRDLNVQRGAR